MVNRPVALALAVLAPLACTDELADTTPLVTAPRVLAALVEPAEARPGAPLAFRALDVGPAGPAPRALDWALCEARPPLTAPGALSPDCLGPDGPALIPLGTGGAVATAMPANVCQTFGPDQPAPKPGQPPARPADPDPSGGYYQPVRILAPDGVERRANASFEARALCHVAGATPEQQREYDRHYRANQNPALLGLFLEDGTPIPAFESDASSETAVGAGATLRLRAAWPSCPGAGEDVCGDGICGLDETPDGCPGDCASPGGCGGAEAYLWFDPAARVFATRRESIVVSWFATAGGFATARTGRSQAEAALSADSENRWTAPGQPGDVWLWVVLRDDRGGVTWSTHRLRVE